MKPFLDKQKVNFAKTAEDYAKYRQGFPEEFFYRLKMLNLLSSDKVVLDIGTGTGTIARGCARLGCDVTALDPAEDLIYQAKQLDAKENLQVNYVRSTAEETLQPDKKFDVVLAGQCWHWFNHEKAINEIKRVLKPGGKIVIAHYDWLPLSNGPALLSEQLIKQYNPGWNGDGGTGFYPTWAMQLAEFGINDIQSFSFTHNANYTHEAWRGRIRACAGVKASLSEEEVANFDSVHGKLLLKKFPNDILVIPHRCFALYATIISENISL